MAPRKTHSKSRYGCRQCKQRRVKCDETGPPCRHCAKRELPCDYVPPVQTQDGANHTGSSAAASSTSQPSNPSGAWTQIISEIFHPPLTFDRPQALSSRMRDLQLMHHYSTVTYMTMAQMPSRTHAWKVLIPQEGLSYPFLMDGLLSLTSLHLALVRPDAAQTYTELALQYQNSALVGFNGALNHISSDNCHAIFAFSIVTTVLALALPRAYREINVDTPTENILDIFDLLRGIGAIIFVAKEWLGDGQLSSIYHPVWVLQDFASPGQPILDALDELQRHNDDLSVLDANGEEHRIYTNAIDELRSCYKKLATTSERGIVLGWPLMIDPGFVTFLKQDQPMAVLIFVYYGVLMHRIDDQWWARGVGKRAVTMLCSTLHEAQPDWDGLTEEARREVGLVELANSESQDYLYSI